MMVVFLLIEIQLIYNIVLVSDVQQSDPVIHNFFFRFLSISCYYKILNVVLCGVR